MGEQCAAGKRVRAAFGSIKQDPYNCKSDVRERLLFLDFGEELTRMI